MLRRLAFCLLLCAVACLAQRPVPILFDTDIGSDIDDALALALALQSPELDVRGVTTVSDDVESRTRLAWKELALFGRKDVPLATGASEPLLGAANLSLQRQYEILTPLDTPPASARRRAAEFLVATLMSSPDKLTLVPVGPLTNIALALRLEPAIRNRIERIVLMGGAFNPPRAEYNIARDPTAAEIVFRSGVPITAVGLDVTTQCRLTAADIDRLKSAPHETTRFLVRLIDLWRNSKQDVYPTLHDPLAVAVALDPSLVTLQSGRVEVELKGSFTAGTTVFQPGLQPTTQIARTVDARRFIELFLERLTAAPRRP